MLSVNRGRRLKFLVCLKCQISISFPTEYMRCRLSNNCLTPNDRQLRHNHPAARYAFYCLLPHEASPRPEPSELETSALNIPPKAGLCPTYVTPINHVRGSRGSQRERCHQVQCAEVVLDLTFVVRKSLISGTLRSNWYWNPR